MGPESEAESVIRSYMATAESYLAQLNIYPRDLLRYPFDSIALEMTSKAFSICDACLLLLREGHQEEAYGLSRSLTECALILPYLTKDSNDRASESAAFVRYSLAEKNLWLYHARKNLSGTQNLVEVERLAKEWKLTGDPQTARRGWSSKFKTYKAQQLTHPLDGLSSNDAIKAAAYALDYTQTSQFVHCSQPGLDNFYPDQGVPFRVKKSRSEYWDVTQRTPYLLLEYLHSVIQYSLFGMGQASPQTLLDHFSECLEALSPVSAKKR